MDETIKIQIEKYTQGFTPEGLGKAIEKNTYIDFITFAEFWQSKMSKRSLMIAMHYLHKWQCKVDEKNLKEFNYIMEDLNNKRHQYKILNHTTKTGKQQFKNWTSSFERKSVISKRDNFARFKYNVYLSLKKYLVAINKKEWTFFLPDQKEVKQAPHNIRVGHLTEEEMLKLYNSIPDSQLKSLIMLLFYTGMRINEVLNFKKTAIWIDTFKINEDLYYSKKDEENKKLFKINLPREFIKRNTYPYVYIDNVIAIKKIIEYLNTIKDGDYVFKFVEFNKTKDYFSLQRERVLVEKKIKQALVDCGLEFKKDEITPHSLRRSNIHYTDLKTDHNVTITQARARHSNFEMTAKYLKPKQKELEEALKEKMK